MSLRLAFRVFVALLASLSCFAHAQQGRRTVAITLDDVPGVIHSRGNDLVATQEINRKVLEVLKKHHVPATGFVIGSYVLDRGDVSARLAILQEWISAGMDLGNHTYSHLDLNTSTAAQFERDAVRGEGALRPILEKNGRTLRYLRFPYNHTGDGEQKKAEVRRFLVDHHYEIATCTVENFDFTYDLVYFDSKKNHDSAGMQRLRDDYLRTTDESFAHYEKLSKQLFGREIPLVMLMHANGLNADALDDVLTTIERRGYSFIPLAEAQSDAVYASPDTFVGTDGRMWMYRWASVKGKLSIDQRPVPARWVLNEFTRLSR